MRLPYAKTRQIGTRYVYVCHSFLDDIDGEDQVQNICRTIEMHTLMLPVTPSRDLSLERRLKLIESCSEFRICGHEFTEDMADEIWHAQKCQIPILHQWSEAA